VLFNANLIQLHVNTLQRYTKYYKTIGRLALPLFIGQLGNIAVSFADNIMVGHYSTDALASASFVNNVFNIAIFACLGFTYGLTPLLGALFAKGDSDSIGHLTRVGLRINTVYTIIIIGLMLALYFNVDRLGQPEHLLPLIRPYFLIVLAGMLPMMLFSVLSQWSFAVGNTSMPTWIVLSANVINVIGNYFLIFGKCGMPELGLVGAGISTFTARILCAVTISVIFFAMSTGRKYRPGFRRSRAEKGEITTVARTGFPVSMQMAFETAAFSGAAVMAGWLGRDELAAFQIVVISGMFGFCLYYSIGTAMAIPLSHAAGRGDNADMRRWAWAGYHIILATMLVACSIFIFFGRPIMSIFTTDAAVRALAFTLIFPLVVYQFGDATQITFANALRGTSHVMPMLWCAFISYVVVGLPSTYLLGFTVGWGLWGIILSFSASLFMAAALYFFFFMRTTAQKSQKIKA